MLKLPFIKSVNYVIVAVCNDVIAKLQLF